MTYDDFKTWLSYHSARFTIVARYMPNAAEDRREVQGAWYQVLSGLTLDEAKDATDAIAADASKHPGNFDKHPAVVRQVAKARRQAEQQRYQFSPTPEEIAEHDRAVERRKIWQPIYDAMSTAERDHVIAECFPGNPIAKDMVLGGNLVFRDVLYQWLKGQREGGEPDVVPEPDGLDQAVMKELGW